MIRLWWEVEELEYVYERWCLVGVVLDTQQFDLDLDEIIEEHMSADEALERVYDAVQEEFENRVPIERSRRKKVVWNLRNEDEIVEAIREQLGASS